VPAYPEAIIAAMALGGPELARRYIDPYLARPIGDRRAKGMQLAARLMYEGEASRASIVATLDTSSAEVLEAATTILGYWPDSTETLVWATRALRAGRRSGVSAFADSTYTAGRLARALSFRGHLAEALAALPGSPSTRVAGVAGSEYTRALVVASNALLGLPASDASQFFGRLANGPIDRPTGLVLALPWWSSRKDTLQLQAVIRRAAAALPGARGVQSGYVRYVGDAAKAYLALARSDTGSALRRLLSLPESGCMYPYCLYEQLVVANLLSARGDHTGAIRILDAIPNQFSPITVLWRFRRAEEAEAVGRREVALMEYRYVAAVWLNADAVLQPIVIACRDGIDRLTAVR
jgi:hypothetical protein